MKLARYESHFSKKIKGGSRLGDHISGGRDLLEEVGIFDVCLSKDTVGYMWEDLEKLGRKEMFLSVAPSKVAFTIKPKPGHFPHRASHRPARALQWLCPQQVPWSGQASGRCSPHPRTPVPLPGWRYGAQAPAWGGAAGEATGDQQGRRRRGSVATAAILPDRSADGAPATWFSSWQLGAYVAWTRGSTDVCARVCLWRACAIRPGTHVRSVHGARCRELSRGLQLCIGPQNSFYTPD